MTATWRLPSIVTASGACSEREALPVTVNVVRVGRSAVSVSCFLARRLAWMRPKSRLDSAATPIDRFSVAFPRTCAETGMRVISTR